MSDPVLEAIDSQAAELFPEEAKVLLAVSGGVDSMVLLHAMHRLQSKWKWRLAISHIDHGTRSGGSAKDRRFVEQAAKSLAIPFCFHNWKGDDASHAEGFEQAAREARLEFHERAAQQHGCTIIAMAHHQDDQAETFMWKLMRGAGGRGLSGMKPLSRFPGSAELQIARPFLPLRKAHLIQYAQNFGVEHREDESNQSLKHIRNRVRHQVLPAMHDEFVKSPIEVIAQAQLLFGAETNFAMAAAREWLENPARPFGELHQAVQRWVVAGQLEQLGIELQFSRVEHLRLNPNVPLTAEGGRVVLRNAAGQVQLQAKEQMQFVPDSIQLTPTGRWQAATSAESCVKYRVCRRRPEQLRGEVFDADRIGGAIQLRHWQPGDRFQPIGMTGKAKLQDLFTNAKVPAAARRQRLVACTEANEIFWVEGLRIGEAAKVRPNTERFLKWICQKS